MCALIKHAVSCNSQRLWYSLVVHVCAITCAAYKYPLRPVVFAVCLQSNPTVLISHIISAQPNMRD
jgi:hypothetical protein